MRIAEIHVYQKNLPIVGGPYTMSRSTLYDIDSTIVKLCRTITAPDQHFATGPNSGVFLSNRRRTYASGCKSKCNESS